MKFGDVSPPRTKPVTHDQVAEEVFLFIVFLICSAAVVLASL